MPPEDKVPPGFEDFELAVRRRQMPIERLVSREVFGSDDPVYGYTTPEQADALVRHLQLAPGKRLLDIGAGLGWPGVHLARVSGCTAVLSDVPALGLREAMPWARREGVDVAFVRATGGRPPFPPRSFDAIVHTDVL
jgi:cyclopropane fatty-acyl-phospholipid synthase-like methyltransferase